MAAQDDVLNAFEEIFQHCFNQMQDGQVDQLFDLELSLTHAKSLVLLHQASQPIAITALAERLRLSAATAGRTVDRLVREGLVSRTEDPSDRRIKRIAITPEGRKVAEDHFEWQREMMRTICARLADDEANNLAAALQPMIVAAESLNSQEPSS